MSVFSPSPFVALTAKVRKTNIPSLRDKIGDVSFTCLFKFHLCHFDQVSEANAWRNLAKRNIIHMCTNLCNLRQLVKIVK